MGMSESPWLPAEPREMLDLKTDQPHSARIYDYYLGGRTNYAADREQAERVRAEFPTVMDVAQANRAFMRRVVRYFAEERGIRQFLDVGAGIPISPNLHEVAQSIDPACRIVYVDNDPIVLTHSRALHNSAPEGVTAYLEADVTAPEGILSSPVLRETLDLAQPVALTLLMVLNWLPLHADAHSAVRTLADALPPGSTIAVTHYTKDFDRRADDVAADFNYVGTPLRTRTRAEVGRFFDGFDLVHPGLCLPQQWRPEEGQDGEVPPEERYFWAGAGVKTG
jgi:hypothetical protein